MKYRYIVIEGNIGVGKTSLAGLLSDALSAKIILEEFKDNPFLPLFYKEKDRFAFHLELSFLAERHEQLIQLDAIIKDDKLVISDYHFHKTSIFAKNNLAPNELSLFNKYHKALAGSLIKPDLIIYLQAKPERLLKNIAKRGREYEKYISEKYLEQISMKYQDFLEHEKQTVPILCLDINDVDFIEQKEPLSKIFALLEAEHPIGITSIVL